MAEETIITWNATNWVTVVVMVAIGFMVLAVLSQLIRNWRGSRSNA
jgi:hypothetical protein